MIVTHKITATVAGSDGSASGTGSTEHPVNGVLIGLYVDYVTQPATADVTIATAFAPVRTLLTLTDNATDGWYYPRVQVHGVTGTALTLDGTRLMVDLFPIDDYVTATVAQGNEGSVTVYLLLEC